jgi:hypothetical protein
MVPAPVPYKIVKTKNHISIETGWNQFGFNLKLFNLFSYSHSFLKFMSQTHIWDLFVPGTGAGT